jgi:MoxR-like ATPase
MATIESIDHLQQLLRSNKYIPDRGLTTAIFLAHRLHRPLFLEGEAGVGKTEVGKVLAEIHGTELIRLQCYEGLDVHHAVYEWNYTRQMLNIRLHENRDTNLSEDDLFSETFLIQRPLLQALRSETQAVLLVDEIDRSDVEFEAFLLEMLSDYQVSIPEIGTIHAKHIPIVVITSNRTREIHDAIKRRCIYHWIDYPSLEKELEIITTKIPGVQARLAKEITKFVQELRKTDLFKIPGVAETLDWTSALVALDQNALDITTIEDTVGVLLKYQEDIEVLKEGKIEQILERSKERD